MRKICWNQSAYDRLAERKGHTFVIAGLITMPVWGTVYLLLIGLSRLCRKIGDFGDWLDDRII